MKALSARTRCFRPRLEADPLLQRQDARHDVEGNQPLRAFFLAVHGEGDADAVEQGVRLGALLRQPLRGLVVRAIGHSAGSAARAAPRPGTFRYTVCCPKIPLAGK